MTSSHGSGDVGDGGDGKDDTAAIPTASALTTATENNAQAVAPATAMPNESNQSGEGVANVAADAPAPATTDTVGSATEATPAPSSRPAVPDSLVKSAERTDTPPLQHSITEVGDIDMTDSAPAAEAVATPQAQRAATPTGGGDVSMQDAANSNAAGGAVPSLQEQTVTPQRQPRNQSAESQNAGQDREQQPPNTDLANTTSAAEQYPPSTPYTPAAMSTLDQQAYMMMALASMSGAPSAMSPPPTVTPSQVTLPNLLDESVNGRLSAHALRQATANKGLESFARIEFADSVFQMTTYAVIVGRDQRALEQARRDEKRDEDHKRRVEENASKGLPPPTPIPYDRSKFSKSYVSEEGGMLGPESDSGESERPAKRRKTSTAGSSQNDNEEAKNDIISNRQYVSHTPGAAAVDLTSLRPSPWHVPFIGIHSPGPNIASKTKAISREHLKISYNQDEGVFEAIPLHKNGFFCEDVHYKSDKVVLKCGDRLQIKDIDFRFIINGVERGCTGAAGEEAAKKKQSVSGKEMSFDFEQAHGNGQMQDTSDELSEVDSPPELSELGVDDDDEAEAVDEVEPAEGRETNVKNEMDQTMEAVIPQIPKKRGPGRPPKNGIMSKREQRLLKKQQQEMAKKTLPQAPPIEPPMKRKVGRPRKHPLPEDGGERPEKRKYKPRKPKNEDGTEVGSDAERKAKEKKEKKARPKSPPLELKIEDYSEEQLQKPNKNYGVLIDETLTAAGPDGLTLKQIYKRICQRYPWFYFHTETKGWESSVRHNLIGNDAFKKDETTNLWSRLPGVELDAGKKRKASSPDRTLAAQGYGPYSYPYNAQHMAPGGSGFPPGQAPPGYQVPAYNGQPAQPGRPVQQYTNTAAPAATGQPPHQVPPQPPAPTQLPPGYGPPPAPARPQAATVQRGSYSSPYASRPPPTGIQQPKVENGHATPNAPATAQPNPAAGAQAAGPTANTQQAPTINRHSATPPTTAPARAVIDPRLLSAVVGLKNGLVENLKKARNPKAEAIVMSALNRCVGLKKEATENDKMEAICIKGIRQVIDGFTKNKSPTPGGSVPPDTPPVFETKVLGSLNGFKDVSIKTLKARLGEAKAEAVTLSAIDRAIGLADASIVPQAVEGESTGNLEGLEQHLIKSIRQLLMGMNQKLQSPG